MKDIEIIEQVLRGNHLEPKEIERAKHILHSIKMRLQQ